MTLSFMGIFKKPEQLENPEKLEQPVIASEIIPIYANPSFDNNTCKVSNRQYPVIGQPEGLGNTDSESLISCKKECFYNGKQL